MMSSNYGSFIGGGENSNTSSVDQEPTDHYEEEVRDVETGSSVTSQNVQRTPLLQSNSRDGGNGNEMDDDIDSAIRMLNVYLFKVIWWLIATYTIHQIGDMARDLIIQNFPGVKGTAIYYLMAYKVVTSIIMRIAYDSFGVKHKES